MTLNEYQMEAAKTAIYPNKGNNLTYPILGLAGEAGEICDKFKKVLRDSDGVLTEETRIALILECGDAMWYVAALAGELGTTLDYIATENLNKLKSRQERGKLQGSGDDR